MGGVGLLSGCSCNMPTRLVCDKMTQCEQLRLLFPKKKPEGGAGQCVCGQQAPERGAWRRGRAPGVGVGHSGKRAAAGARRGQWLVARRGQGWGLGARGRGRRQGEGWAWVIGGTWVGIVGGGGGDGPRHM